MTIFSKQNTTAIHEKKNCFFNKYWNKYSIIYIINENSFKIYYRAQGIIKINSHQVWLPVQHQTSKHFRMKPPTEKLLMVWGKGKSGKGVAPGRLTILCGWSHTLEYTLSTNWTSIKKKKSEIWSRSERSWWIIMIKIHCMHV